MNLPLVIDIALGLVFIYLTLSLLTSEIQELIATVLQWRAEHLKKSIENLLTGEAIDDPINQKFVDELYRSPLIKSLNQEAKGSIASFFRNLVHAISTAYRRITRTRNVFGHERSAPSYIPAETFSVALLQKINVTELSQKISELTASKFRNESLDNLREILEDLKTSLGHDPLLVGEGSLLEMEFRKLEQSLENTVDDFVSGRVTLAYSLDQISDQLMAFIDNTDALLADDHHCKDVIRKRLSYLKKTISRRQLEPTITEVLRLIFAEETSDTRRLSPWSAEVVARLNKDSPDLIQQVNNLPYELKRNLLSLADQARIKANSLEAEVRQLEREVADWFQNSMNRASGVYRRNSKGIAILIGFLTAILINADTLHMIDRLSKDNILRSTITQAADRAISRDEALGDAVPSVPPPAPVPIDPTINDPTITEAAPSPIPNPNAVQTDLQTVRNAVDDMLDEMPLPIGWHPANVQEQVQDSRGWGMPILRRLLGWLITGIALSMGATFWFDLLNRVMKVRSTGKKPENGE